MTDTGSSVTAYEGLGPEAVLSAVDNEGFQCDGRMLEMNSFENRVYQLGPEDGGMLIA